MKRVLFFNIIIALFFVSCVRPEKPVAKIDSYYITFDEWQAFAKSRGFNDFSNMEKTLSLFDEMILREKAYVEGEKSGLLKTKAFKDQLKILEQNVLIQNYLLKNYLEENSEPSEEELYEVFKNEHSQRNVYGVLINSKEEAYKVYERLKKGEDIAKIFLEYKDRVKDGPPSYELGPINFSQSPLPIQKHFFNPSDEIIVEPFPFRSQSEYMVVILKKLIVPPKPQSYDPQLITKARGLKFQKAIIKANNELMTTIPDFFDKELMEELLKEDKPSEDELEKVVGRVGSIKIRYADLLDVFYNDINRGVNLTRDLNTFKNIFDRIASEKRIYQAAKKLGYHKDKKVLAQIWNKNRDMAFYITYNNFIKEYAVSDEELRNYYEQNKNDYLIPLSFKLKYLICNSIEIVNEVSRKVKSNIEWGEILKMDGIAKETGSGDLGWKTEDELKSMFPPNFVEILSKTEKGKFLVDRLPNNKFVIVYLEDKKEPRIMEFELCKERVKGDYKNKNGKALFYDYLKKMDLKVIKYEQNLI